MGNRRVVDQICDTNYNFNQPNDFDPTLCDRCKDLLTAYGSTEAKNAKRDGNIYCTNDLLETTAAQGCPLCQLFYQKISVQDRNILRENSQDKIGAGNPLTAYYRRSAGNGKEFLRLEHTQALPDPDPHKRIYISAVRIEIVPATKFEGINSAYLGKSTSSNSSMEIAKQWVDSCEKHHGKCRASPSTFIPARLIDIGIEKVPKLRLVDGKDLAAGSKYVTLSHCWGKFIPMRLLKDNLASMMDTIPIHQLSSTFQDAIEVAGKLGVRYIWIDSLCIIQDDLIDWQENSATMGQVYAHSCCNISATASEDGSQGLYRSHNPLPMQKFLLPISINNEKAWYYFWDEDTWQRSIDRAPLNQRAWVCQERFLSPCNLHFASDQLFWECRELAACEVFPTGFPEGFGAPPRSSKKWVSQTIALSNSVATPSDHEMQSAYENWKILLLMYTTSRLSFEDDKLVALSGLAAIWSGILKDEYVAGHWRKMLPAELIWYSPDPRCEHENRHYTAPSWSWAAIDGPIINTFQPILANSSGPTLLTEIRDIKIEIAETYSPYGQVKGGYLVIEGRLARAGYKALAAGRYNLGGLVLHMPSESAPDADADIHVYWDVSQAGFRDVGSLLGFSGDATALYLLPIIYDLQARIIQGLVLRQTGKGAGEFKRLGVFKANGDFSIDRLKESCNHYDSLSAESGLDRHSDANGDLKYTILLV